MNGGSSRWNRRRKAGSDSDPPSTKRTRLRKPVPEPQPLEDTQTQTDIVNKVLDWRKQCEDQQGESESADQDEVGAENNLFSYLRLVRPQNAVPTDDDCVDPNELLLHLPASSAPLPAPSCVPISQLVVRKHDALPSLANLSPQDDDVIHRTRASTSSHPFTAGPAQAYMPYLGRRETPDADVQRVGCVRRPCSFSLPLRLPTLPSRLQYKRRSTDERPQ